MLPLQIDSLGGVCDRVPAFKRPWDTEAPEHANRAGRTADGDGCGRARAALQGTHDHRDGELSRLQVPIETLRSQEFDCHAGYSPPEAWFARALRARPSRLGAAAADSARVVPNRARV